MDGFFKFVGWLVGSFDVCLSVCLSIYLYVCISPPPRDESWGINNPRFGCVGIFLIFFWIFSSFLLFPSGWISSRRLGKPRG